MKVYIISSPEISDARLGTISEIAGKSKGPIEFIFPDEYADRGPDENEEDVTEEIQANYGAVLESLPWSRLFGYCEDFRRMNRKVKPDDLVVFFTDHGNFNDLGDESNWFSSWDPSGKHNFFIQTSGWDSFIESEECYPIIYELITFPLFLYTCKDLDEVKAMAHYDPPIGKGPQGCPWDFCEDKSQVQLRLRTGDVCPDCRKKMIENKIDPAVARQIFSIMDDIRGQMLFRRQFRLTKKLSRMEISKFHHTIRFTDIGNIPVKLQPREITVYLFFLNHPEGVGFPYIVDYREEIRRLYRNFTSDANLPKFNNTVEYIVTNEEDTLSQLITNINKKIRFAVGKEISGNYTINGDAGEPRSIVLDRSLISVL